MCFSYQVRLRSAFLLLHRCHVSSGPRQRRSGFWFVEKSIRLHLGDIGVDRRAYSQLLSGRYLWLPELRNESRARHSRQSSKGERNIAKMRRSTLGFLQADSNYDSRRGNYGRCEDLHGISCESFLRTVENVLISRERNSSFFSTAIDSFSSNPPNSSLKRRILIVGVWFSTSLAGAVFLPNISLAIHYLGALAASFIFIFPGSSSIPARSGTTK